MSAVRHTITRLRVWWGSPVIISRLVLFLFYLSCAGVGAGAWLATNPTLDHAIGDFYTACWGVAMTISGLACAATVTSSKLEVFEQGASIVLSAMLIAFVIAVAQLMQADGSDRIEYMTIAVALSILPVARTTWLISRSGSRRE